MVTYTKTPGHSPCTGAVRPPITRSVIRLLAFLFSLLLLTTTAFSQVDDFNQAQNDKNGAGAPYNIDWVNGILNATHTSYFEGVGIPQRLIFTNIPATSGNVHVVKFEHLAVAGGKHAYDFLMSWQQAQATAGDHGNGTVNELQRLFTDQCNGAASADGLATCSALVPFVSSDDPDAVSSRYRRLILSDNMADPSIGGNVAGKIACFEGIYGNRYIELIGNANITNASITFDGYKPGTDLATYTITWTSTSDDIMIRFAGRAAKGPGACGYGSGLGAGSISGGNYHFKLASLDGAPTGSQDNQLMSNAIPEPPDCGIEPGKLACPNTPSLTFSYTGVTTGVSLVWSFLSNTANAVIQNTTANPTVTIVPGAGGFTPGGSFQLHLAVSKNGVTTECDQATASTIQNVVAQATADPTTIILTAANHSSQLNARVSLDGGTTYLTDAQADAQFTFSWVKDPPTPTGGTLSATNIRNPVFTAASPAQSHTFTVTATQKAAPFCSAQAPVTVEVSSGIPNCPEISGPDPVCEGTTGLTYSAAGSIPANTTYTWSIFSGNAQITSSTVNVTSITVNAGNTDYVVRLTMTFANPNIPAVPCDYAVDVDLEPDANAGPDQRLCDATSITLAGNNPSAGTGTWTKQSGPSATITSPNAFNSTVTGLTPGTYVFRWTIVNGTCDDFDEVQVIIDAPVDANAGPDRALCGAGSVTLAGNNPSVGTGTWTKQSGPAATITSPNAFNTTVTGLTPGTYVFRWTIVNGTCSDFDEVTIRIDGDVTADAGDDQRLCDVTTVTLDGNNPSVGTGTWTKQSGPAATITSPNAFNTTVTGLTPGTYVFRWTVVNGECSIFDEVQVIIDAPVDANAGPDRALCAATSITLAGNDPSVGTGTWTKQSGPAATITSPNAFNSTVTGLTPGTYVFRWTIVNGTCDDFDEVTIHIDGDVIALAGDDQSLCAATLATLAGTNPSAGTGTWTKLSGPDVTITTPTAFNTSVTGLVTGTYVFRWTVVNGECSAFDDVQVTIIPNPTCSIGGESSICSGSSNVYQGPAGMDAYAWSFVGAANGATFLNGVTNTQSVTVVAGTGNYTLQLIVTDNGCSSTCTQPVTVASCAVLCTYTQGAYGNAGGMHCNGQPAVPGPNQFTTAQYITNSINTYTLNSYTPALPNAAPFTNQMLVIGKPGRSVYMTSSVGDVGLIIEYLPGGGGSKVLGSGNISISNAAGMAQYLKNGRINNTLLAQTMTLGINLGGSGELGDFALEANKYLVTADVVSCGSTEIKECEFHWDGTQWVLDYTPYKVFGKIPQALYNAISPKTVRGLFTYANNVLGGDALASGVSLTMVADAVDLINNAFDGCRDFVTWHSGVESYGVWVAPSAGSFCTPPAVTTARAIGANSEVVQTVDQLNVRAYPNPYNSTVSFNFTSPVKGNASLEVFDVVGRRLAIVFQGQVDAGIQKSVLYRVPTSSRVPMIYKLTIGDKTSYGKLLPGSTD